MVAEELHSTGAVMKPCL